jgi:thioester reductase-like protein
MSYFVTGATGFIGRFLVQELQFDVGQGFPSPYHRTKFESEKIVREECPVPWRIYRPAVVIGHSETGAMDKIDGPYYFFRAFKVMRDVLPGWVPLLGVDLGDTNIVPVDYVAKAMDYLAHVPGANGQAFHLVNPEPQRTIDVLNAYAEAANAPRFAVPVDRSAIPLPSRLQPVSLITRLASSRAGHLALKQTLGRLGLPPEAVAHAGMPTVYAATHTERALAASGISVPSIETYADKIWGYWEEQLDTSTGDNK